MFHIEIKMDVTTEKIDYAVTENMEILLDLGPVDSVAYKISDREENVVLTSNHAQESQPKTIYACHVCDEIFHENSDMLKHLSEEHRTEFTRILEKKIARLDCTNSNVHKDCNHDTQLPCDASSGQDRDDKPYKCAHCGDRFKSGNEVGIHMMKHSCDFCGKIFEQQSDLDDHVADIHSAAQKENLTSQHRCGHCGVSFNHRNTLYKHIKSHREPFPKTKGLQDETSPDILSDVESSLMEKGTSDANQSQTLQKYSCKFCHSNFDTKESLTEHISSHPEWKPSVCEVCGEYFAIEDDLKEHHEMKKCKILSCSVCSRVFRSQKRLEGHLKIHSKPASKPVKIKTVKAPTIKAPSEKKSDQIDSNKKSGTSLNKKNSKNKTLIKEKKLTKNFDKNKKHLNKSKSTIKSKSPVSKSPKAVGYGCVTKAAMVLSKYKCNVCKMSFPLLKQLTAHMKWHCTILQKFECEYCDRCFNQRKTYFSHLLKHYKKSQHSCQHCSMHFNDADQLKAHMKSSCKHKRMHTCTLCNTDFDDQLSLKRHRETAHPLSPIFTCNICSRQFATKKQLNSHRKGHLFKKRYECEICSRTFNRWSLLFQHLATHAQKLMYKCRFCPRLFPSQRFMQKHLSTHTNVKSTQNACIVCKKTFQNSENLSKHLEVHLHRGDQPLTCCQKTFTNVEQICNHLKLKSHTH